MIGLTIGLLVVVAALTSLATTQLSSSAISDSAQLQQTADSLFRTLGFQITQAGALHLEASPNNPNRVRFSAAFTGFDPAITHPGARIFAIHGQRRAALGRPAADTLRTSIQDNGITGDCAGRPVAAAVAGIRVDSTFYLAGNQLMCRSGGNPIPQRIGENVRDFQVRYAVQRTVGTTLQTQFFSANGVPDWTRVSAVSICLQIAGEANNAITGLAPLTGCNQQPLVPDGHLQLVTQRLFNVRNARP